MAYKVVKNPRVWFPVKWDGLAEDGTIVVNAIEMRFRLLKVDEAVEFMRDVFAAQAAVVEAERGDAAEKADLAQIHAELIARIASDWRHIEFENGEPMRWDVPDDWLTDLDGKGKRKPLKAPNVRMFFNEPGTFLAAFNAWRDAQNAKGEIRAGN
ncbi:histidine kinase [Sphingomonas cannabina]|uniref:histidine kinase n=1 Tax=Sphingomonas cannabina TaxID=2899123 RepID=UPI001F45E7DA|nr:histidine kinase [Sphingomonas cannabina]UIJ46899.1 histidine kinase [Sphingomonas cannabina]